MAQGSTSKFIARRALGPVLDALGDTRIVLVNGARQSGKSTLVRRVGRLAGAEWYTLDAPATRAAATSDPATFVRLADRMIVDEIQREPGVLLAMKALVDEDPTPGRFLLTGSARVLGLRDLPDALVGRMETIELWPLSQGEIDSAPDGFIDVAFSEGADLHHESELTRDDYIDRIARGGFPDAITRPERRRMDYHDNYVADLINRDVVQLSQIERAHQMHALVRTLAARSGQTIAPTTLGAPLGLPAATTRRYLRLLEEVFLIKRIPAWTRRISSRAVGQDKLAFVDSGVACTLLGQTPDRLRKLGSPLGGLLEGFAAMELARQLTWSRTRAGVSHYRTKDKVEVDIVLEDRAGQVIGIEVKASASPSADDFAGLRHLAARVGDDFLAGFVLHTGRHTLPFGPRLRALPLSAIWQCGADGAQ